MKHFFKKVSQYLTRGYIFDGNKFLYEVYLILVDQVSFSMTLFVTDRQRFSNSYSMSVVFASKLSSLISCVIHVGAADCPPVFSPCGCVNLILGTLLL